MLYRSQFWHGLCIENSKGSDMMDQIKLEGEGETESREIYPSLPQLEKAFQKHGAYDGKLFHSSDKVTYTFVADQEVISLHFDRVRKTIFYQGHNIDNLILGSEQIGYLEKFAREIEANYDTSDFIVPYSETLKAYLQNHPSTSNT